VVRSRSWIDRRRGASTKGSRPSTLVFAALGAATAFTALHALFGVGGAGADAISDEWIYTAVEVIAVGLCAARVVRRREDRAAWLLVTLGILGWTLGDLVWTLWLDHVASPPYPSVADALYLTLYPTTYAALTLLMRSHFRHAGAALWLDGAVVGLALAAVGAELVFPAVVQSSRGSSAAIGVNLAYPVGDLMLLVFIALGFVLSSLRPGRQWLLLALGVMLNAIADMVYVYQVAKGSYVEGSILDTMWPASMALLAAAAWQPPPSRGAPADHPRHTVVLPAIFALLALGLLIVASLQHVSPLAVVLAAGALLLGGARAGFTYAENARMLRREMLDATTDTLTGLGNRRRLMRDLDEALIGARAGADATLAFFDLDGFKRYNDSFGHGAGDALLIRLGRSLAAAVAGAGGGGAYRLGGDEFCVLLGGRLEPDDARILAAREALAESGSSFSVAASCGVVVLAEDASSVSDALNLADERMYADKSNAERATRARGQNMIIQQNVLMQLLTEREPALHDHVRDVGKLAMAVGRRFGLNSEQLDELRRAAELHDLGKLAVPEQVLDKAGPLSEGEWQLMRQHTIIGERILSAAPALRPVGRLVRSSHERWDGEGYPDGLAAEKIPLGSRIIAACDAYDAILSERPYDGARSPEAALQELRRHAGSQFDPRVVEALCEHLEAQLPASRVAQRRDRRGARRSAIRGRA
jgi:two-component system cell cycle response regulator